MSPSTDAPSWLHVLPVGFPSANLIVTDEGDRVLFDSGYGSDRGRIEAALAGAGVPASTLELVVNTHWHSDHVGGNAWLQTEHAVPVAAASADAKSVNSCRLDACLAEWLDQPVEQYRVDRVLLPGDLVTAGPVEWQVLATPGHTPNHLSFYQPEEKILVLGDAVHVDDVGWINLALDGPTAIDAALGTVDNLSQLPIRVALPGHGPVITEPAHAFAMAHATYQKMQADPQRAGWHACKRIFAFALMIHDGLPIDDIDTYLTSRQWLIDHASTVFHTTPAVLSAELLAEMRRAGATEERDGQLYCRTPHHRPATGWRRQSGYPGDWLGAGDP